FAADWLAAGPVPRHWQAAVNFGVLATIYAGIALDLRRHARDDLGWRWPLALGLSPLLGAAAFGTRAARALIDPASVAAEMATHSALNVGSAFGYLVLVLLLHATLLALVAGRLVTSLRRLSRHDGLTGLLNRRAIEEALDAQRQRSQRIGEAFALMMLDLDHFKAINDRHGHAVGDQALKQVAALLRGSLREVDRLGRYGGEEFLILLPGLTLAEALAVARRLCADLSARQLHTATATLAISASVGVAAWQDGPCDVEQVLAQADAALFEAKLSGRNRAAPAGAVTGGGDNAHP
ncbi:MAG TPA: GGDEF domain-containing protein, partial [Burkholderiaceae bacterium]|nr:GGDEF domain-containing protein [Burkholderiaceae bacterium]